VACKVVVPVLSMLKACSQFTRRDDSEWRTKDFLAVDLSRCGLAKSDDWPRAELLVRGMRGILGNFMKDSVVRGRLLQLLFERRGEDKTPFGHVEHAVQPPGGISRRDWLRAVAQLSEYQLIDWTPLEDKSGMG